MPTVLVLSIFVLATAAAGAAQFIPCKAGAVSTVGHTQTVTVQTVSFLESYGEVRASVFLPDSKVPVPGIVFSHSAIRGLNAQTDLNRFALALARAGAASIVLEGTIEWDAANDDAKRPAHVMACAGQWLLLNARLDRNRLAVAGPVRPWGGGDTPFCLPGERPCWSPMAILNFGQASSAESGNTDAMLTLDGQIRMARFAQKQLHLAAVEPDWLSADSARNAH